MLIRPLDYFLLAWFVDQYRDNPEPTVMTWGFILVTLYVGPFGLLLYVMTDKEPRPGEYEAFVKPLWRQHIEVEGDPTQ